MTLVQQSGDLELINILQGTPNQNIYNPQNLFNITVLIPQQMSIQQLGTSQELALVNNSRKRILSSSNTVGILIVWVFFRKT
jgi:hypothetical protein